jgi:hypothetical protein
MKKQSDFQAFCKALWDQPVNKVFAVLEILGFVGAAVVVIDHLGEAAAALLFVAVLVGGNYLIFKKQKATIVKLQRALVDTAPDIVPMPIEIPSSGQPFTLRIRNEGKSSARNIGVRMNYKDYIFSARRGSLKPDEETSLELTSAPVGTWDSRVRVHRMIAGDQTVVLNCEFSSPSGIAYITRWECEWSTEWTFKNREPT